MKLTVMTTAQRGHTEALDVSESVFGRDYNEPLVHQVVVALQAGLRAGTQCQKGRAEVSGGGRKPWRQKGTGRARAGSNRSPLWRGGGVIFPAKPRDYDQKINKKMYTGAMRAILSELIRQGRMIVVDAITITQPKTKEVIQLLKQFNVTRALLITEYLDENLYLAARNVPNVQVLDVDSVNPLDCVHYDRLVITVGALKRLEEQLA